MDTSLWDARAVSSHCSLHSTDTEWTSRRYAHPSEESAICARATSAFSRKTTLLYHIMNIFVKSSQLYRSVRMRFRYVCVFGRHDAKEIYEFLLPVTLHEDECNYSRRWSYDVERQYLERGYILQIIYNNNSHWPISDIDYRQVAQRLLPESFAKPRENERLLGVSLYSGSENIITAKNS